MNYINSDGNIKIAYEDLNPQSRKTVVFIHGWPLSHKVFEYQNNILPYKGYRTVTIDLRGFGESDAPAMGYGYDTMAKDIYNLIAKLGLQNITLAGFSMGGAVALRYIKNYNGWRVGKLALLSAAAPLFTQREDFPYGQTKTQINDLIMKLYIDRPTALADFSKDFFYQEQTATFMEWFRQLVYMQSSHSTINALKSLRDEDLREDMAFVKVKTGIFHGKKDKICPYQLAEEMRRGIKDSVLYPFENSGHGVFKDETEEFNDKFLEYIE